MGSEPAASGAPHCAILSKFHNSVGRHRGLIEGVYTSKKFALMGLNRRPTLYKTVALTDELVAQLKYYGPQNPTPHLKHESSGAAEVAARKFPRIEVASAI